MPSKWSPYLCISITISYTILKWIAPVQFLPIFFHYRSHSISFWCLKWTNISLKQLWECSPFVSDLLVPWRPKDKLIPGKNIGIFWLNCSQPFFFAVSIQTAEDSTWGSVNLMVVLEITNRRAELLLSLFRNIHPFLFKKKSHKQNKQLWLIETWSLGGLGLALLLFNSQC